ncbi:protein unc-93 homolog A-like [Pseudophryne corroboree]|uniref:protein unc-93 homolog A-like n=1 Tax=Pseudophryne corroboree TaxID=495146 RepID=UPI0030819C36
MEIKHLKNLIIVSFGFLLLFTAYGGLQSLQSSLNPEKGLGVASLSVIYGCLILSSLFLAPILIKKIGCKWTIVASMCCYITYSVGNFQANWYSIIITSAILGFGGGPLWTANSTYLTTDGSRYAELTGKKKIDVLNQYFGVFFLIYQTSGIWGNLISSLVLVQNHDKVVSENASYSHCGATNCPASSVGSSNITVSSTGVSDNLRYTLMGIYTGCGVLAVLLIVIFLEQIDLKEELKNDEVQPSIWKALLSTILQLKDLRQCLLIPITMVFGFQQGFLSSDFTQAYVTCSLGIHFVGYVMICGGATSSICSLLFGKLSQYTGRIVLFIFAAAATASSVCALLLWKPNPNQLALYFIIPALWNMSDSIRWTLLNTYYGVLFADCKEAAFSNYNLWQSLGFVIAFAYSNILCVYMKIYIVLSIMLLGTILYLVVEFIEYRKSPKDVENTNTVMESENAITVMESESTNTVKESEDANTVIESENTYTIMESEDANTVMESESTNSETTLENANTVTESESTK